MHCHSHNHLRCDKVCAYTLVDQWLIIEARQKEIDEAERQQKQQAAAIHASLEPYASRIPSSF